MCVDVATPAVQISEAVSRRWAVLRVFADSMAWYSAMTRMRCVDAAMALREMAAASLM